MLKAMGIEEDTIEQIIEAHTETTDSLKAERDRYKGEAERAKEIQGELEATKAKLKEALEDESQDELKTQLDERAKELRKAQDATEKLQEEFDAYKSKVEADETNRRKTESYRQLLEKAGIAQKYVGKVLRVTSLDDVELDDDGNVRDAEKAIEGIKAEWPEFIAKVETKGSEPENPPKASPSVQGVSDRAKRIIAEHYEKRYGKSEE